ncbi:hypothetical protein [Streptomyces acidiscabies]|uniref:Alpha/beta hydrolase family protein n=3 Tax=Streptomyces acidiscabies TaxID=42234 RepID=A0AAP6BHR5_9ACTN|nr:hypothetical protein [Streptomyces acidiscabies]MBP5935244.1 hypothetical protein [Streptomyces sp. LBUM 1476]MBZ3916924.1 hypothetical protein [Streptomyces acidiscabies]MDX2964943.1 hypothetical protein [Streptomyces acidiscabies]MDX3024234.1 hypothetical protein [Streptomyces acidiscabies]MDX3793041.1 hypothetical protein [Streptomyces acidiscabies]
MTSVVLVHGTGVREDGYASLFTLVSRQLAELERDLTPVPCFWGEEHGARLHLDGASLPTRPREDIRLASWGLLDADPLAELRLLAEEDERDTDAYVPPRDLTPVEELAPLLADLAEDPVVRQAAQTHGLLPGDLAEAAREVGEALTTLLPDTAAQVTTVRQVTARAVVASALASADLRWDAAGASLDGRGVEELLGVVLRALGEPGAALGVVSDVTRPVWLPFWRGTEWAASWRVRRSRTKLSAQAAPPIGDILRYQARGEGLRRHIRDVVEAAPPPVVLLAHSLGGIACVDLLATEDLRDKVRALVTVGSQAPFLYELDALHSLSVGDPLPATFPRHWINVYDPRDPLAHVAAPVFGADRVTDVAVDTRRPLLRAHSAYWDHAPLYRALERELFGGADG